MNTRLIGLTITTALAILSTIGCTSGRVSTTRDLYPEVQNRGYVLLSGRNDASTRALDYLWNIPMFQYVDGEKKQLGLMQIGEPRPPWVSIAPRNANHFLVTAPVGTATFRYGYGGILGPAITNDVTVKPLDISDTQDVTTVTYRISDVIGTPISVPVYRDVTTRVTMVLSGRTNSEPGSYKYGIFFEIDDPNLGRRDVKVRD